MLKNYIYNPLDSYIATRSIIVRWIGSIGVVIIYREERDFVPPIMQNHNNNTAIAQSTRESRFFSFVGPRRGAREGRESHQLRLEINRRQMRRSPAGPVAAGDRILTPRSPPRGQYDCFQQIQNDTRAPGYDRHTLTRQFPIRSRFIATSLRWHDTNKIF